MPNVCMLPLLSASSWLSMFLKWALERAIDRKCQDLYLRDSQVFI